MKSYLYIGHYIDEDGRYIMKVGVTKNLIKRKYQHNRFYRNASNHRMPRSEKFAYNWWLEMSRYTALRMEEMLKEKWIEENLGEYVREDRFAFDEKPEEIEITIRKTYTVKF